MSYTIHQSDRVDRDANEAGEYLRSPRQLLGGISRKEMFSRLLGLAGVLGAGRVLMGSSRAQAQGTGGTGGIDQGLLDRLTFKRAEGTNPAVVFDPHTGRNLAGFGNNLLLSNLSTGKHSLFHNGALVLTATDTEESKGELDSNGAFNSGDSLTHVQQVEAIDGSVDVNVVAINPIFDNSGRFSNSFNLIVESGLPGSKPALRIEADYDVAQDTLSTLRVSGDAPPFNPMLADLVDIGADVFERELSTHAPHFTPHTLLHLVSGTITKRTVLYAIVINLLCRIVGIVCRGNVCIVKLVCVAVRQRAMDGILSI